MSCWGGREFGQSVIMKYLYLVSNLSKENEIGEITVDTKISRAGPRNNIVRCVAVDDVSIA